LGKPTQKCLPLNLLDPTRKKERLLRETYTTFFTIVQEALSHAGGVKSRAELHDETYEGSGASTVWRPSS
jgi:hypothetical protein